MLKSFSRSDIVEVFLSDVFCDNLEEELRLIKELAYPRPVVAHLSDLMQLDPLLEKLAIAGLCAITFEVTSSQLGKRLVDEAKVINLQQRLGLTFYTNIRKIGCEL